MKTFIANLDAIERHPYYAVEWQSLNNENYHILKKGSNGIAIQYQKDRFGVKFHKTKHVYQFLMGNHDLGRNSQAFLVYKSLTLKADYELEAHRLQFALQSPNRLHDMPTSNKIYSVYDFQGNYEWLGSIMADDGSHPYKDAAHSAQYKKD